MAQQMLAHENEVFEDFVASSSSESEDEIKEKITKKKIQNEFSKLKINGFKTKHGTMMSMDMMRKVIFDKFAARPLFHCWPKNAIISELRSRNISGDVIDEKFVNIAKMKHSELAALLDRALEPDFVSKKMVRASKKRSVDSSFEESSKKKTEDFKLCPELDRRLHFGFAKIYVQSSLSI